MRFQSAVIAALASASTALPGADTHRSETMLERTNRLTNVAYGRSVHEIVAGWDLQNLTLAAVRHPPVNWPLPILNKNWDGVKLDLDGTVDLAITFMEQAAANNVRLIGFPEVWFPGYPKGVINDDIPNLWFEHHSVDYIKNSLEVGSSSWNKLVQGAIDNEIYLGFGFSERDGDQVYIAQALVGPDGKVLIHRHKLRPAAQERDLWSDGKLDQIYAVSTPIGRIGMLSCFEHITPEATFLLQAQTEDIHIGSWPYTPEFGNFSLDYESAEAMTSMAHYYAMISNAAVIQSTVGTASIYPGGEWSDKSQITANVSWAEHPMVTRTFNASNFANVTYNPNAEVSWATLHGINVGFPSYIPKDFGDFASFHSNSVSEIIKNAGDQY